MLTIGRRIGEVIKVTHGDEELEVHLTNVSGKQAKLSFEGPLSFKVVREELINKKSTREVNGNR